MSFGIWQRTITDETGNVLPASEIEVREPSIDFTGDIVELFSNETGTAGNANPFTADSEGFAQFYAAPRKVDIRATGSGSQRTWRNVEILGTAAIQDTSRFPYVVGSVADLRAIGPGVAKVGQTVSTTFRATAGDGGACDYVIEERDGQPDSFLTEYLDDGVHQARFLRGTAIEDVTVLIPTQYPDLQSAVDDLHGRVTTSGGVFVDTTYESGHQPTSGAEFKNGDYSQFRISSQRADNWILVDGSFSGQFLSSTNVKMPVLNCIINLANISGIQSRGILMYGGSLRVAPGCGVINAFWHGIIAFEGAAISADDTVWDGNSREGNVTASVTCWGSFGSFEGASCKNSGYYGLQAAAGGVVNARGVDVSGAGRHGARATNGSIVNFRMGVADNCVANAINSYQGSTIEARGASAKNAGEAGALAAHCSRVNFHEGDASGSATGVRAQRSSAIDARQALAIGCNIGVRAEEASTINFELGKANDCTAGVLAGGGSTIHFQSGEADNCARGIDAIGASTIDAKDASATNCTERGVRAFESSSVNFQNGNASGSADECLLAVESSEINARNSLAVITSGNSIVSDGGSRINARGSDIGGGNFILRRGSFIVAHDTAGAFNYTPNTLSEVGAIFKNV